LREKKYASEVAIRYGLSYSLLRAKDIAGEHSGSSMRSPP
jgi:hypothetical protein